MPRDGPPGDEFLKARLAAAAAVPPEERSADASAFVESYELQKQVAAALTRPAWSGSGKRPFDPRRWTCLEAVKYARSIVIAAAPLPFDLELEDFVLRMLLSRLKNTPGGIEPAVTVLLREDTRLETVATVVAVLRTWPADERGPELFAMANEAVALLQQPAVRTALRRELASLGRQLLSYEQLLASFVYYVLSQAPEFEPAASHSLPSGAEAAISNARSLLPQLVPDSPSDLYLSAMTSGNKIPALLNLLRVAEEQRSDVFIARAGYALAMLARDFVSEASGEQNYHPPSLALGWLEKGEAAHRRSKPVLPKHWTYYMDNRTRAMKPFKDWLLQQKQQGDTWRTGVYFDFQAMHRVLKGSMAAALECDGCGQQAAQLRRCSACKAVQYCR